jgi:hypothetical protein
MLSFEVEAQGAKGRALEGYNSLCGWKTGGVLRVSFDGFACFHFGQTKGLLEFATVRSK